MDKQDNYSKDISPAIRRARFDKLTIYEISEDELNTLEKGSPNSVYLNISIALLAAALTCLLATPTVNIESKMLLFAFISFTVIGFIVGGVLLVLWVRGRSSVSDCVKKIRRRLPPEGESLDSGST